MLKTIIVPVDFSDEAGNALLFAAELCKRTDGRLSILHVLSDEDSEAAALSQLEALERRLKDSFGSELQCSSLLLRDGLIPALESQVKSQNADLVVMGTKGATGLKRIFIGSNTVKVLAHLKSPVLVVPETARFEAFNRTGKSRVVLATDLMEVGEDQALDVLAEITSLMIEPKLRILNVRPKNTSLGFEQAMERSALLTRFRENIETERITVFDSNVMDGIKFYLHKHDDTGLLAMVARDTGGLFQRHFTHEMASITEYPLLVMHG
ncbi:universal stress protein [Algoriphagus sp. H41]|uniref:Universal stress protein n=1 Tax=Algoriphagus oliviformis TaxID=2811231 RepID=A0ABS3BYJ6_9BACT|nr:universal stress protein [Algoriphagus oliviformis]MBN7809944.1 universal stress protein [Algoriphagus oliviformis]